MEPLDVAKNDENSGYSKPRISSILKAPRKPLRSSDPEQVENVVECAKPVEKRNSRRVSFAPSNDVLLFSKEVKSVSPSGSPLQVLKPPASEASKENRLPAVAAAEGIQQVSGMETLLNAPLHASQQRDQVYFDTEQNCGEKTVMFAADDALMDMTHSHTINLASDPELRAENLDILSTRGEKAMLAADGGSMGMTKTLNEPPSRSVLPQQKFNLLPPGKSTDYPGATEKKSTSSLRPDLDPGFKNFLASLCKPSGPAVNPVITRMVPTAAASCRDAPDTKESQFRLSAEVDKENQAPASISALKGTSLSQSGMTRGWSDGRTPRPEGDVSTDTTKAHSVHVCKTEAVTAADAQTVGFTDADDPFRCLFSIPDLSARADGGVSQRAEKLNTSEQSSKTRGSFSLKALEATRFPRSVGHEVPQSSDVKPLLNLPLQASQQRRVVNFDTKDECREQVIMDTTWNPNSEAQLHLSISGFLTKLKTQRTDMHKESLFPASTSAVTEKQRNTTNTKRGTADGGAFCLEDDVCLDITKAQTDETLAVTGTGDALQCLRAAKDSQPHCDIVKAEMTSERRSRAALQSSSPNGLEAFSSASLNRLQQRHQVKLDVEEDCEDKTVRFSSDNACMDVTRSYTVNIKKYSESQFISSDNNCDSLTTHGEKKMTFDENDGAMNISQRRTGDIARHAQSQVVSSDLSCDSLPTHGEKTMRFDANDGAMDITQCHTVNIDRHAPLQVVGSNEKCDSLPTHGEKTVRFDANDGAMDITQCHTVDIDRHAQSQVVGSNEACDSLPTHGEKTMRFDANDGAMDITQCHTVNIDRHAPLQVVGSNEKCDSLPTHGEKTVRFDANDGAMDITQCHTVDIDRHAQSQVVSSDLSCDSLPTHGEKTMRFDAIDGAMDMTQCHTVNIDRHAPLQVVGSNEKCDSLPTHGAKTVRFDASDGVMDITQCHTVDIDRHAQSQVVTSDPNCDSLPNFREKAMRFDANDGDVDINHCPSADNARHAQSQVIGSDQNFAFIPIHGEKTARFDANDGAMDMTQCHTVNIDRHASLQVVGSNETCDSLPTHGEKTVRFDANDGAMDITQCHTVDIDRHAQLQVIGSDQNFAFLPIHGEKTMRFDANDGAMDITQCHTVNIDRHAQSQVVGSNEKCDSLPTHGEKTMRFDANDGAMDITQCHTVNIDRHAQSQVVGSNETCDSLPTHGEKTMRFDANDGAMDITQCHTVDIDRHALLQVVGSNEKCDSLPTHGEKTMRFDANDGAMDITQCHTVNIDRHAQSQVVGSNETCDSLPTHGEKTMRFDANDGAMDMTQCHTVDIDRHALLQVVGSNEKCDSLPTHGEKTVRFDANDGDVDINHCPSADNARHAQSHVIGSDQNFAFIPIHGEKTARFDANDGAMDMTQCHTVNIDRHAQSQVVGSNEKCDSLPTHGEKTMRFDANDGAMDMTQCHTADVATHADTQVANSVITKAADSVTACQDTSNRSSFIDERKPQKGDEEGEEPLGFVPTVKEKSLPQAPMNSESFNRSASCLKNNINLDVTDVHTDHILGQMCRDQPLSSVEDLNPHCDLLNGTEGDSHQCNEAMGSSNLSVVRVTNCPDSVCPQEVEPVHSSKVENRTITPQNLENSPGASAVVPDPASLPSQKRESTRISLADLRSKVKRLSHIINEVPESVAVDNCTVPLSQMDDHLDSDSVRLQPSVESDLELSVGDTGDKKLEQPATTTTSMPFNLKTQKLMSRLSMGGFMPKLPQRSKSFQTNEADSCSGTSTGHMRANTIPFAKQLKNSDDELINIYDEVLGSDEDLSETLDTRCPQTTPEKGLRPSEGLDTDETLVDDVFTENVLRATHGRKRLSDDGINVEAEKRMRPSTDGSASIVEMGSQSHAVESGGNITAAPSITTQTTDSYSASHTASIAYEATFESTSKQSLFESQLEDYGNDVQKKLNDGTITVLEFFKLFNLDFVIHHPRQSVIPGKLGSDMDCTQMDLLRDKHISRPKQMVYETNVLNLTEKVDGLKVRKQDLQKPLKIVNRPLWEEMRNSSEKELRCLGAKLKERNNFFRKMSKVQSHEMKEVLHSALVQANLDVQQKLKSTIEKADEMLKTLDGCISELETELAAVEENGFGGQPSLKFYQQELKKATEALADNDRRLTEAELQKKQASDKVTRLKAETEKLENHISVLHTINEWKLGEQTDSCTVYTFLYDTLLLQLDYEKSDGKDADESQRKMARITFKFLLDEDKSQCHARLVQKLLLQYFESEAAWTKKYPNRSYVPKLLHDVSFVVSRCRLLGEELRLLKMWGGLRLDILDISCVDTRVHIVFSSLRKLSKFEVVFAVSLNEHICVQVQDFRPIIGSTAIRQIEEIVASFPPTKNLLTKVVKKIHEKLLC